MSGHPQVKSRNPNQTWWGKKQKLCENTQQQDEQQQRPQPQRLGAEDGLILGSVHPHMALEFVRWLQKTDFSGHVYFDTFPRNEDPVREAEYNIRKFKRLWRQAKQLQQAGIDELMARQDAMAVLEMLEAQGM